MVFKQQGLCLIGVGLIKKNVNVVLKLYFNIAENLMKDLKLGAADLCTIGLLTGQMRLDIWLLVVKSKPIGAHQLSVDCVG